MCPFPLLPLIFLFCSFTSLHLPFFLIPPLLSFLSPFDFPFLLSLIPYPSPLISSQLLYSFWHLCSFQLPPNEYTSFTESLPMSNNPPLLSSFYFQPFLHFSYFLPLPFFILILSRSLFTPSPFSSFSPFLLPSFLSLSSTHSFLPHSSFLLSLPFHLLPFFHLFLFIAFIHPFFPSPFTSYSFSLLPPCFPLFFLLSLSTCYTFSSGTLCPGCSCSSVSFSTAV